jgi:hypothetical protein
VLLGEAGSLFNMRDRVPGRGELAAYRVETFPDEAAPGRESKSCGARGQAQMRFSLQSKVRIYVGAHNGWLAAGGQVAPDRDRAIVITLDEALKSTAMISGDIKIEYELVPDASGT